MGYVKDRVYNSNPESSYWNTTFYSEIKKTEIPGLTSQQRHLQEHFQNFAVRECTNVEITMEVISNLEVGNIFFLIQSAWTWFVWTRVIRVFHASFQCRSRFCLFVRCWKPALVISKHGLWKTDSNLTMTRRRYFILVRILLIVNHSWVQKLATLVSPLTAISYWRLMLVTFVHSGWAFIYVLGRIRKYLDIERFHRTLSSCDHHLSFGLHFISFIHLFPSNNTSNIYKITKIFRGLGWKASKAWI